MRKRLTPDEVLAEYKRLNTLLLREGMGGEKALRETPRRIASEAQREVSRISHRVNVRKQRKRQKVFAKSMAAYQERVGHAEIVKPVDRHGVIPPTRSKRKTGAWIDGRPQPPAFKRKIVTRNLTAIQRRDGWYIVPTGRSAPLAGPFTNRANAQSWLDRHL
jgi:hypothetical protein